MKNVRVGVAAIVYNADNEVLIGKRKSAHGYGQWGFPGGHMEMYETPIETARRETMEEAGITLTSPREVGFSNDIFGPDKHYITLFVEAEYAEYNGENVRVMEPDKMECWEWHDIYNLPQPTFQPIENMKKSVFRTALRRNNKKMAAISDS